MLCVIAKPLHAGPVGLNGRLAVHRRVGGRREEHALVPLGLFILADTAGLGNVSIVV